MKNLIRYEFRKTWSVKLILLFITAFAEAGFLISLYLNKDEMNGLSIMALTFLAIGGILIIGVQSVMVMHQDMNTKQGYMLYMTPNNCYKILGGKVIENGLSLFAAGAFFFALGALDVVLLVGHHGVLDELIKTLQELMRQMSMEVRLELPLFIALAVKFLCGWLCTVVTAFLADVISTCLLSGKRHNGWISLLIFILLTWMVTEIGRACTGPLLLEPGLYAGAAIDILFAAGMYLATAALMERHLSV